MHLCRDRRQYVSFRQHLVFLVFIGIVALFQFLLNVMCEFSFISFRVFARELSRVRVQKVYRKYKKNGLLGAQCAGIKPKEICRN